MKKRCPKCLINKNIKDFNWKNTNIRRATYCKNCSRKLIKTHYNKNKEYYLKKAKIRNLKIKTLSNKYIYSYLKKHPCVDCGEKDILVLEFDHKDKTSKNDDVSRIIRSTGSIEKLKEEVSKCEVRCANCHRRKTSKENNSWKLKYAPVA